MNVDCPNKDNHNNTKGNTSDPSSTISNSLGSDQRGLNLAVIIREITILIKTIEAAIIIQIIFSRHEAPQTILRKLIINTIIKFMRITLIMVVSIVQEFSRKTKTTIKVVIIIKETPRDTIKNSILLKTLPAEGINFRSELNKCTTFKINIEILIMNINHLINLSGMAISKENVGTIIIREIVVVDTMVRTTVLVTLGIRMGLRGTNRKMMLIKAMRSTFTTSISSLLLTKL